MNLGRGTVVKRVVVIEPTGYGGICHYTYSLCQALEARGTATALITARDYELAGLPRAFRAYQMLGDSHRPEAPSTTTSIRPRRSIIGRVFGRRLRSAWTMLRIVAVVLQERAPVAHVQWSVGPHDWIYLMVLRLLGRRIVYTSHNVVPHERGPEDIARLRRMFRCVDRVILHSRENAETFTALFGDASPETTVIPHGNYSLFADVGATPGQENRQSLGVPLHARVILFFGSIRGYKGLEDLIRAFGRVRDAIPDAWLVIAGQPWGPFRRYAMAMTEAKIEACTALHLRYHPLAEVAKFFRAADLVVLPYRRASQSGIVQLAFAFGKPVVATRVGGLPEAVDDGLTGLLVPPGDEEALAQAITQLLRDPRLLETMGARAAAVATSRYSWDRVADATQTVYDALNGWRRPGALAAGKPADHQHQHQREQ